MMKEADCCLQRQSPCVQLSVGADVHTEFLSQHIPPLLPRIRLNNRNSSAHKNEFSTPSLAVTKSCNFWNFQHKTFWLINSECSDLNVIFRQILDSSLCFWVSKRSGGYLALANLHGVMKTELPDDWIMSASASWGIMGYLSKAWHGENCWHLSWHSL